VYGATNVMVTALAAGRCGNFTPGKKDAIVVYFYQDTVIFLFCGRDLKQGDQYWYFPTAARQNN